MQTTLQAPFRSTITGVVVRSFRSSFVPVTHEDYLVESCRPLWFGSSQANRSVFKQFSRKCTNYAEESAHYALPFSHTYSTWLAAILRFRAKSEGLGDFSLLNNETTRTLASSPGSWEFSGSLPELSTAAGPLLLLVLGPLSLLLLGPASDVSI